LSRCIILTHPDERQVAPMTPMEVITLAYMTMTMTCHALGWLADAVGGWQVASGTSREATGTHDNGIPYHPMTYHQRLGLQQD
jgi:hypothetical protein